MPSDISPYCNSVHPNYIEPREVTALDGTTSTIDAPTVWCRRIKNHIGDHAAYTFGVHTPETWSDEEAPF